MRRSWKEYFGNQGSVGGRADGGYLKDLGMDFQQETRLQNQSLMVYVGLPQSLESLPERLEVVLAGPP